MPNLQLWAPPATPIVADSMSDVAVITSRALQLRERERKQIAANFESGNFEVAASFVWLRTMALLRKQLASLGMEFIGELLQKNEIDEFSDIQTAISDTDAISLARDLGILTSLQTIRLLQSQSIVSYFAGIDNDPAADPNEMMTEQEAVACLRVCVQGVLGHEKVQAAEDFKLFRSKLETSTLTTNSPEFIKLKASPYFFIKTAISILLSLFKTAKGAQLEHAARNALLIIPEFWATLKAPERWQVGQAYAVEFSEGNSASIKGLHAVLVEVAGFDYVPENLRSNTFVQVASKVVSAHQAMNNFYNEYAPMSELASLGTSIPGPALAACITAVLCVKLGNYYGVAISAQSAADKVVAGLSSDRWEYYINGRLEQDRIILSKLTEEKPVQRWLSLLRPMELEPSKFSNKKIKALVSATNRGDVQKVRQIGQQLFQDSVA